MQKGPAPSDSESSSNGGVTAFQSSNTGLVVWVCADKRLGMDGLPLGDGSMAEGDRSLKLDVTLGKREGRRFGVLIQDSLTCGAIV